MSGMFCYHLIIEEVRMDKLARYLPPLARLFLNGIFVWSGYAKLTDPSRTAQYIAGMGIPGTGSDDLGRCDC